MKLRATIETTGVWKVNDQSLSRTHIASLIEVYPTHVKVKFLDASKLELVLSYKELSDLMTQIQLKQEVKS